MQIPPVSLQGHVQKSGNAAHALSDPLMGEDLSFLDWLTELNPDAKTVTVPKVADPEAPVKKADVKDTVVETIWYDPETLQAEASEAVSSADSGDSDMKPKELLHLLNEALTPVDTQYLKQWFIPNVPILGGTVPIQQLFQADENGQFSYRGFEVSDNLKTLVERGIKSNSPIRVELDSKSSIILKFKNGRVSAEFLANDQIDAWAVKQQLEALKQQLLSKKLPIDELSYRQQQNKRERFSFASQQDESGEQAE